LAKLKQKAPEIYDKSKIFFELPPASLGEVEEAAARKARKSKEKKLTY